MLLVAGGVFLFGALAAGLALRTGIHRRQSALTNLLLEKEGITMFRPMRRKRQLLSEEQSIAVLQRQTAGVLAVSGDDGYPYACLLYTSRCV